MSDQPTFPAPRRTLLVVDDNSAVCLSVSTYLEFNGYKALWAESGPAALELAAKEPLDGALIDVHMPVMNGFDTCVRLQEMARVTGRNLKIWLMTGALTSDMASRCEKAGGLAVYRKPFEWSELLMQLATAFAATGAVPGDNSGATS